MVKRVGQFIAAYHIWQEVRAIREREPPTIQVALPLPIAIPIANRVVEAIPVVLLT